MVKADKILRNTLDTVEEMTKLIKKSPKRQAIFQKIKDDVACDSPGIRLLAPTRWTIRARAFTSISENYVALWIHGLLPMGKVVIVRCVHALVE